MTYFACDIPSPTIPSQILGKTSALEQVQDGKSVSVFALVDGAFDEEFFLRKFRSTSPRVSLYSTTPLAAFGEASLFIVRAPNSHVERSNWLVRLIAECKDRPMWSIIVASIGSDELVQHLSRFLIGKCEDTVEWPIRWGDTRVLARLLNQLPEQHVHDLLAPLHFWFAPSRSGELLRWDGSGACSIPQLKYVNIPIDNQTFGRLVDACEADAVIAMIAESDIDLLKRQKPSHCHRLVERQLKIADTFNVNQAAARQHFALLGMYLHESFVTRPEFQSVLAAVKRGANYFDEIKLLPSEFWNELGM